MKGAGLCFDIYRKLYYSKTSSKSLIIFAVHMHLPALYYLVCDMSGQAYLVDCCTLHTKSTYCSKSLQYVYKYMK